jgi:hypothetical protein
MEQPGKSNLGRRSKKSAYFSDKLFEEIMHVIG